MFTEARVARHDSPFAASVGPSGVRYTRDLTDQCIVRQFQEGNIDVFDELVSRYESRIYGLGRRMCRNDDDAKDLLQETFISAFRGLDTFRGDAKFSVWLFQIAKHACVKMQRRSKFAPRYTVSIDTLLSNDNTRSPMELVDRRHTPEDALLNMELHAKLEKALQQLPSNYRIVLMLRDVEGFTVKETATILECSIPAVKTRLHRARLIATRLLRDYHTDTNRDVMTKPQCRKARTTKRPADLSVFSFPVPSHA